MAMREARIREDLRHPEVALLLLLHHRLCYVRHCALRLPLILHVQVLQHDLRREVGGGVVDAGENVGRHRPCCLIHLRLLRHRPQLTELPKPRREVLEEER